MKSIQTLYYDNRQLLVLTVLLVIVGGLSAIFSLPRLEDPYIRGRNAVIVTSLPGASAERVEALVTEKLEEELQEVSEIDDIESVSRAGVSLITVELKGDIVDIEPVWTDIRDHLADAEGKLPPQASKPDFDDTRGPWAFSLILGLKWQGPGSQGPTSNGPTHKGDGEASDFQGKAEMGILDRLSQELADRLRNIPGTQLVRVYGEPEEEITVTVDPQRLSEAGLTAAQVAGAVAAADSKTSAGIVRGTQSDLFIEVQGEIDSLQRLADIPLRGNPRGGALRLADVAEIERSPRDPQSEAALVDGRPAILIAARVEPDRRLDLWTHDALEVIEEFESGLSSAIGLKHIFQQSSYTLKRLGDLAFNLAAGMLIVMLVLVFTMGWRAALLVGSALPLSSAAVLFGLQLLGVPLQQMSVTGLIIALGLLIDNAIVIVDEVSGRLRKGDAPRQAVARSVGHLFVPLLGSTLTTVLAFAPILLLAGSVGEFVGTIAVSVILAIVSSFAFAMTVVPTFTAILGRRSQEGSPRKGTKPPFAALAAIFGRNPQAAGSWWQDGVRIPALTGAYRRLLVGLARHPLRGVLAALLVPMLGFALAPTLRTQFFPPADRDQFYVQMWMPSHSSLENTRRQAQRVEDILRGQPAITDVDWLVGASAPTLYYNMLMNQDNSSRYAHALVRTTSYDAMRQAVPRLQERIDRELPQSQTVLRLLGQGPPVDAPLEIRILGPSLDELRRLGDEIRARLHRQPEVLHTRATLRQGEPKVWVEADEDEARLAGLDLTQIARQLQDSLEGRVGGSLLEETEELPVRVRYADWQRNALDDLGSLNLVAPEGEGWIPLSALADVTLRPELEAIPHHDGERVNVIKGYIHADALAPQVTQDFLGQLRESAYRLPPGYRMEMAGEAEEQAKATANLLVYVPVLAILMLASLVLSFRSFALSGVIGMVAVLSVGLGLFFIYITGYPWGFMAMIGTAGLIGVAINDSIVVLAAIRGETGATPNSQVANSQSGNRRERVAEDGVGNHRPAADQQPLEPARPGQSIVEPVLESTRHVISTTLTTAAGFMPLIIAGGDFWPPLAVVIAGGVTGATLLALIFTPSAYLLVKRLQHRFARHPVPQLTLAEA